MNNAASFVIRGEALVMALAWLGAALWLAALVLSLTRRHRGAAMLQATLAMFFVIPCLVSLLRWSLDPAGYVLQYGAAAVTELRLTAVMAVLSLIALACAVFAVRGRLRIGILAWLINGAGLAFLFYLAYFFRIF